RVRGAERQRPDLQRDRARERLWRADGGRERALSGVERERDDRERGGRRGERERGDQCGEGREDGAEHRDLGALGGERRIMRKPSGRRQRFAGEGRDDLEAGRSWAAPRAPRPHAGSSRSTTTAVEST